MRHGATLTVGGVTLQLRLFAGVRLSGESPVRVRKRRRQPPEIVYYTDDESGTDGAADVPHIRLELPKPALTIKTRKSRRP